ncbi:urea amidolyase associated protein UAAP1 [Paenibacillus aestuarii]|uniref:Urea amidolyase associated protein UAAP1 n=1 Tax=Paenibacillus aestuarii TaxID=516965 RepID=A0ABW0K7T3_9BACL|nr:urea amidolyase associated protein UAAP1 [Paenibacillus aestuarii]
MNEHWNTTIHPGGKWSGRVGAGKLIRYTALASGANLAMLLYNSRDLTERYNMPDTLKAQHTAHLTKGHVLMSDNGNVMASIVEDSLGWHDPISGYTTRKHTDVKYGITDYQTKRNDWLRSGQDNFIVELVRNGLGTRDLMPPVNWFAKVQCDEQGRMRFNPNHAQAGAFVTMRTEMEVLLVLSNTPNPLDPAGRYPSVPILMEVMPAMPPNADDLCVNFRPENERSFDNTRSYHHLLGT